MRRCTVRDSYTWNCVPLHIQDYGQLSLLAAKPTPTKKKKKFHHVLKDRKPKKRTPTHTVGMELYTKNANHNIDLTKKKRIQLGDPIRFDAFLIR